MIPALLLVGIVVYFRSKWKRTTGDARFNDFLVDMNMVEGLMFWILPMFLVLASCASIFS